MAAVGFTQWGIATQWASPSNTSKRTSSRQTSSKAKKQRKLQVQPDPRNPNGKVVIDPVSKEKYFMCCHPGCGSKFTTRFSLKRHNKRHTGERPHQCPQCHRRFGEKSTLKRHLRTHTGERPFQCTFRNCNKSFADRTNVRRHMLTHMDHPSVTKAMEEEAWREYNRRNPVAKSTSSVSTASDESDDSADEVAYTPRLTREERMARRRATGSRKAVAPVDMSDAPVIPTMRKIRVFQPIKAPHAQFVCPCDNCDLRAFTEQDMEAHLADDHTPHDSEAMATLALLFLRRSPRSAFRTPQSPSSTNSSDTEQL